MALLSALCVGLNALGFTNRSLRAQVSHLIGVPTNSYTLNQASYDLARLRLNGLIERREHSNTYDLTPDGQRVAIFYTKVHDRLPRPLIAADQPPAPPALRLALRTVDEHVHSYTPTPAQKGSLETQDRRQSLDHQGTLGRASQRLDDLADLRPGEPPNDARVEEVAQRHASARSSRWASASRSNAAATRYSRRDVARRSASFTFPWLWWYQVPREPRRGSPRRDQSNASSRTEKYTDGMSYIRCFMGGSSTGVPLAAERIWSLGRQVSTDLDEVTPRLPVLYT